MKRAPIHPDARICPRCQYANVSSLPVCVLCRTSLPEQPVVAAPVLPAPEPVLCLSEPPQPTAQPESVIQTIQPPKPSPKPLPSKPLPFRSQPVKPLPLKPLPPEPTQPPLPKPPSPAKPRGEKLRATMDNGLKLIRSLIVWPLSAFSTLQGRIRSFSERRQRRSKPEKLSPARPLRTRPSIIAVATRRVAQVFSGLYSLIFFAGQKARALRPRIPSLRPHVAMLFRWLSSKLSSLLRLSLRGLQFTGKLAGKLARQLWPTRLIEACRNFRLPSVDLRPAIRVSLRFTQRAFFFLAGLGGMVLKALLSAIIFLLEQSRQLLQLVWSLRSIKLPTIKLPSVKLPSIQLPSIKPATKPVDVWQQCQKPDREEEQAAVTPLLTRELPTRTAAPASARNQVTERTIQPRIKSTIKPAVKLPTKPAFNFNLRRVVEYGGLGVASITVLVILGLSFTTIEQAWASWRASQARFGEIKIQEDYHSASKRTWVKLEPLQVLGEHSNGLKIGASFSYPGRFLKQDPTSMTLLLTSITTESKYAKQHDLIAVADGETVKLGSMSRTAKQVEVLSDGKTEAIKSDKKNGDHVLEMLTLNVPTMTLNKIAQSKEVKMKLGDTEFALADVHLTALRDLLERAIQEPQKGK